MLKPPVMNACVIESLLKKLEKYENATCVEDVVLGTANDLAQRQGMLYIPADLIGKRVRVLIMPEEGV